MMMKDGFEEAVVACDMPDQCQCPSLDSCQKRFLWTHKELNFASHPAVGLVLQVGDTEKKFLRPLTQIGMSVQSLKAVIMHVDFYSFIFFFLGGGGVWGGGIGVVEFFPAQTIVRSLTLSG